MTNRQKLALTIVNLLYDKANVTCDTNIEPAAVNTLGLMAFRSSRYSTPVGGLQIGCRVTPYGVNANFILKEARAVNALKGIGRGSIVLFASRICLSLYYHTTYINMTKDKSHVFSSRDTMPSHKKKGIKTFVLRHLMRYLVNLVNKINKCRRVFCVRDIKWYPAKIKSLDCDLINKFVNIKNTKSTAH